MKCIALTGGKQHGKSTAAAMLAEMIYNHDPDMNQVNVHGFAWDLKYELAQILGHDDVDYEFVQDFFDEAKEKYPHVRKLLQSHGDFQKEVHGKDYWINKLDTVIEQFEEFSKDEANLFFIIPDLRFLNELEYLQTNFAPDDLLILRIQKDKLPEGFVPDTHISETEPNSIKPHQTITNPVGDLNTFKRNLWEAIKAKGWTN